MSDPRVVFVHGMFMTPGCWADWQAHFEARGLSSVAPAWPHHEGTVEAQRARHPDPALGALTLADVVAHHRALLQEMDRPVLVGHSMGGLVVQLLLQEGLGRCGVALHSAPPKGVVSLKWSFLKSNWGVISPFANADEPWLPTLEQFCYGFANGLPEAVQRKAYASQVVPESRRVGSGPTTAAAQIDFHAERPPLLLVAGGRDHMIPASLNRTNHERYAGGPSVTELEVMDDRTHLTLQQPGWEAVADHVLAWVAAHGA